MPSEAERTKGRHSEVTHEYFGRSLDPKPIIVFGLNRYA